MVVRYNMRRGILGGGKRPEESYSVEMQFFVCVEAGAAQVNPVSVKHRDTAAGVPASTGG
jgi:hypothetical protein